MSLGKNSRGLKRELQLQKMRIQETNEALDKIIASLTAFGFEGVHIGNVDQAVDGLIEQLKYLPGSPQTETPTAPTVAPVAPVASLNKSPFARLQAPKSKTQSKGGWGLKKPSASAPAQPVAPDPIAQQAAAPPAPEIPSIDEAAFLKSMEDKLSAKLKNAEENGLKYRLPGSPGKPAAQAPKRKMTLEEKEAFMRSIGQEYVAPEGNPTPKPS
jgi:hypothetical protein